MEHRASSFFRDFRGHCFTRYGAFVTASKNDVWYPPAAETYPNPLDSLGIFIGLRVPNPSRAPPPSRLHLDVKHISILVSSFSSLDMLHSNDLVQTQFLKRISTRSEVSLNLEK